MSTRRRLGRMLWRAAVLGGLAGLTLGGCGATPPDGQPAAARAPKPTARPWPGGRRQRLAEGVWRLASRRGGLNLGVVQTAWGPVIVDAGSDPNRGADLLRAARHLTRWADAAYLVYTRPAAEAVMGAAAFTRAEIIASERAAADLSARRGEILDEFRRRYYGVGLDYAPLVAPTLTFAGRLTLHAPDRKVEFLDLGRAATAGDVAVWLPEARVLFAGAAAVNRTVPDLAAADSAAWVARLRELEALPAETVVPAAGEPGGPELLSQTRGYLEALRAAVAAVRAAGAGGPEEVESEALAAYRQWAGFAERQPANVRRVWEELAVPDGVRALDEYRPLPPPGSGADIPVGHGQAGMPAPPPAPTAESQISNLESEISNPKSEIESGPAPSPPPAAEETAP